MSKSQAANIGSSKSPEAVAAFRLAARQEFLCEIGKAKPGRQGDAFAEGDVVAEGRQEGGRVADPGEVVEVLVRVLQHVDPATFNARHRILR